MKLITLNLGILAILLFLANSVQADPIGTKPDSAKPTRNFYPVVSFFYGTDRVFGHDRFNATLDDQVAFGEAQMVLKLHYRRHSDRTCGWWRLGEKDKDKPGLREPHPIDSANLDSPLNSNEKDETFIYVHGFSTSFEEGAKEAAQIAYDLQLSGMPILYSWPSMGSISITDYKTDQTMVNRPETIGHLTAFIERVLDGSPRGRKIHLVGFSMGAYLLIRSLMEMVGQGLDLSKMGAVILISPDIDAQDFTELYFPKLKEAMDGKLVLYVSGRDKALVLSSAFHQGKPRLGQGGDKAVLLPGITTIDATQSSLDCGICHGLSQINGVINDMYLSLHQGLPTSQRLIDPYEKNGEKYYVLFDDSHEIVTIRDHNFAIAGQLGTYLDAFKMIWLPEPEWEISAGVDRGYLPRDMEVRWNLLSKNLRPYLDAGMNYFDLGHGETAWAANEGLGLEYAFDSGIGLGLEWDNITGLERSPSLPSGSVMNSLLKNADFPWSGFHIQLIQYFDFNKLLD